MKILVIGANGQLGWELIGQSKAFGFETQGIDQPQLNITDPIQVEEALLSYHPSLVVNAAAYTQVDRAETEQDMAFAVNRDGAENIAKACALIRSPLIHISTDFVFNGLKTALYSESDPISPINVYGQSKAEGEKAVRSRLNEHIIIRTSWLYGVHGNNFVKTMLALGMKNQKIRVVTDQYGSPTAAPDLAEAIWTIAAGILSGGKKEWGTYHYSGYGVTSWHRFSETIFDYARQDQTFKVEQIDPITSDEFEAAAQRPGYSALDCSHIEKTFGIKPKPWQESLARIVDCIYMKNK